MGHEFLGARVRRYRRFRGLGLDQAAGLAGISKSYLSRLERGERSIDSRALLLRIAVALEVSVADLTGQPYVPRDRDHGDAHRGVAGIRLALLDPSAGPGPGGDLDGQIRSLLEVVDACDLVRQGRLLPDLLRWCQIQAQSVPSPRPASGWRWSRMWRHSSCVISVRRIWPSWRPRPRW
jgi:transcriptional regulator with XRE-family HTH domain